VPLKYLIIIYIAPRAVLTALSHHIFAYWEIGIIPICEVNDNNNNNCYVFTRPNVGLQDPIKWNVRFVSTFLAAPCRQRYTVRSPRRICIGNMHSHALAGTVDCSRIKPAFLFSCKKLTHGSAILCDGELPIENTRQGVIHGQSAQNDAMFSVAHCHVWHGPATVIPY
jgi:hypothetical protein